MGKEHVERCSVPSSTSARSIREACETFTKRCTITNTGWAQVVNIEQELFETKQRCLLSGGDPREWSLGKPMWRENVPRERESNSKTNTCFGSDRSFGKKMKAFGYVSACGETFAFGFCTV